MSDLYGPADEAESRATIAAALDQGITLFDTGDYYGMGHNELLLRDAVRGRDRARLTISVKFGALRDPEGNWIGFDGRPVAVKTFLAYTLRRLGTDYVGRSRADGQRARAASGVGGASHCIPRSAFHLRPHRTVIARRERGADRAGWPHARLSRRDRLRSAVLR